MGKQRKKSQKSIWAQEPSANSYIAWPDDKFTLRSFYTAWMYGVARLCKACLQHAAQSQVCFSHPPEHPPPEGGGVWWTWLYAIATFYLA